MAREGGSLSADPPAFQFYLDSTGFTTNYYTPVHKNRQVAAAEHAGPAYARNAEALRGVQPEDVLPGDIDADLGAPWMPANDIQTFAADLFHVEPSSVPVSHLKKDAVWSLDAGYAAAQSVAAASEHGTAHANGTWLLDLALNLKTPVIYDTINHGDREERVVNQEATLAALQSFLQRLGLLLEQVQPTQRQRIGDRVRAA